MPNFRDVCLQSWNEKSFKHWKHEWLACHLSFLWNPVTVNSGQSTWGQKLWGIYWKFNPRFSTACIWYATRRGGDNFWRVLKIPCPKLCFPNEIENDESNRGSVCNKNAMWQRGKTPIGGNLRECQLQCMGRETFLVGAKILLLTKGWVVTVKVWLDSWVGHVGQLRRWGKGIHITLARLFFHYLNRSAFCARTNESEFRHPVYKRADVSQHSSCCWNSAFVLPSSKSAYWRSF